MDMLEYIKAHGLQKYMPPLSAEEQKEYEQVSQDPNYGVRGVFPLPPESEDLVFLHQKIRERKAFTVLEFGVGYSTLVMAHALLQNKREFEEAPVEIRKGIRCNSPFELHAVDASTEWIDRCKLLISSHPELVEVVTLHHSDVSCTQLQGRMCHAYSNIPDVIPDFIYLDGPSTEHVSGSVYGMTFSNNSDRTVMSADPCIMEPTLLPGVFMVVDGRTNNARFIRNNLQRCWAYKWLRERDVSTFELQEDPLGPFNERMLDYCGLKTHSSSS